MQVEGRDVVVLRPGPRRRPAPATRRARPPPPRRPPRHPRRHAVRADPVHRRPVAPADTAAAVGSAEPRRRGRPLSFSSRFDRLAPFRRERATGLPPALEEGRPDRAPAAGRRGRRCSARRPTSCRVVGRSELRTAQNSSVPERSSTRSAPPGSRARRRGPRRFRRRRAASSSRRATARRRPAARGAPARPRPARPRRRARGRGRARAPRARRAAARARAAAAFGVELASDAAPDDARAPAVRPARRASVLSGERSVRLASARVRGRRRRRRRRPRRPRRARAPAARELHAAAPAARVPATARAARRSRSRSATPRVAAPSAGATAAPRAAADAPAAADARLCDLLRGRRWWRLVTCRVVHRLRALAERAGLGQAGTRSSRSVLVAARGPFYLAGL